MCFVVYLTAVVEIVTGYKLLMRLLFVAIAMALFTLVM